MKDQFDTKLIKACNVVTIIATIVVILSEACIRTGRINPDLGFYVVVAVSIPTLALALLVVINGMRKKRRNK